MVRDMSRFKSLIRSIDWLSVYDAYIESKLCVSTFYKTELPKLIRDSLHEDYIPGIQTVREKFNKIEQEGREMFCLMSRGDSNYKYWASVFDKFKQSGLSMNEFFDKNPDLCCARSTFYRQVSRFTTEFQTSGDPEVKQNQVNVITLDKDILKPVDCGKADTGIIPERRQASSAVTISVRVGTQTTISFESSEPERAVAKLIAAMGEYNED